MAGFLTEDDIERALLEQLAEIGYQTAPGAEISPGGERPERRSYGDVVLRERLRSALVTINAHLPAGAAAAGAGACFAGLTFRVAAFVRIAFASCSPALNSSAVPFLPMTKGFWNATVMLRGGISTTPRAMASPGLWEKIFRPSRKTL